MLASVREMFKPRPRFRFVQNRKGFLKRRTETPEMRGPRTEQGYGVLTARDG